MEAYEQVEIERLPWPRPHEQALFESGALARIEFSGASACSPERAPPSVRQFGSSDGSDVSVRWSRSIPDDTCLRPFLTDAGYADGVLTVVVGLHESPSVVCRQCDRVPYELRAAFRDGTTVELTEVVVEHRSQSGELVERSVVEPE